MNTVKIYEYLDMLRHEYGMPYCFYTDDNFRLTVTAWDEYMKITIERMTGLNEMWGQNWGKFATYHYYPDDTFQMTQSFIKQDSMTHAVIKSLIVALITANAA